MKYILSLFLLFNNFLFFARNTDSLPETRKVKVTINGKDSMREAILDRRYGTEQEVRQKMADGKLECYYVINHGKLYQRFNVLEKESFIEDYWVLMTCAAIVLSIGIVYYKRKPQDR